MLEVGVLGVEDCTLNLFLVDGECGFLVVEHVEHHLTEKIELVLEHLRENLVGVLRLVIVLYVVSDWARRHSWAAHDGWLSILSVLWTFGLFFFLVPCVGVEFEEIPKHVEHHSRAVIVEEQLVLCEQEVVDLVLSEDVDLVVLYLLLFDGALGSEMLLEDLNEALFDSRRLPKLGDLFRLNDEGGESVVEL